METNTHRYFIVYLIDSCYRRRAAISHLLESAGLHAEPFESISDFMLYPPKHGIVLVHRDEDQIESLQTFLDTGGRWLPHVAYSEAPDRASVVDAMRHGACNYLSWPEDKGVFAASVIEAEEQARPQIAERRRKSIVRERLNRLTAREREILGYVASGLSSRAIGDRLGISYRTVEIHRTNIITKMDASNTPEAVGMAHEAGFMYAHRNLGANANGAEIQMGMAA